MANPLFQELNKPIQKVDMRNALQQLKHNPAQLIKQAGYNVPANIANNPQAAVMHLIQSGQVRPPIMNMLGKMMGQK